MKTLKYFAFILIGLVFYGSVAGQNCTTIADWEDEALGTPLQQAAQFGGYFAVAGIPSFVNENCTPGGSVGLSMKAGIDGAVGDVVGYTTQVGINPPPTFLSGVTYNISGKKLYSDASMGTYSNLTMTITLVNGMGATQVVNKSLMLIQGQCDSWDPPQAFVSPDDFDFAEIAITANNDMEEDELFIIIDDWCIEEVSNEECSAEFGYETLDECGQIQLFSNIDGGTFDSWQISGPNGYTTSSNVENLMISLPFSGTYIVSIAIVCEDSTLQTFQQTFEIEYFDQDPIFEACMDGSTQEILGINVDGECTVEYEIPDLLAFDDSGIFSLNCFLDSTIPVTAGQIVSLTGGMHTLFCVVIDNCDNEESCLFNINVSCEDDAPCDYECCTDGPNWPVEGFGLGAVPGSSQTGYYPEFGTPTVVEDGCDESIESIELDGTDLGIPGEIVGIKDGGFGGVIPIFEEGKTYCISYCLKTIAGTGVTGGQLSLFAATSPQTNGTCTGNCEPIGLSPYVDASEGWTQQQVIYTASSTFEHFLMENNNTAPINGAPKLRIDNVCITENPTPITCKVDIRIEEQECGKVIVNTERCGEIEEMTILYDDGFESFEVEDTTACINYTSAGPWTVTVNYICVGESMVRTVSETFTLENKINAPSLICPSDTIINLNDEGDCIAEVILGSYTVDDPSATVNCYVSGILVANPSVPVQIPVGIAQIEYIATNECGTDTCNYEIEVTCEPSTGKYDCPIDVLFVLDNSGSISSTEFNQMVASANTEITALSTVYTNSRFATVHYTGACGEKLWVENDFTDSGSLLPITRKSSGNDDLNLALGSVIKALNNNLPDPDITGGPLNLDPLAKFYVVVFTDAAKDLFNSPTCGNSVLVPYTNANILKTTFAANLTVVHFQPGVSDDACGAIASPGGSYTGLVDINPGDPDNLLLPRQFIPAPFGTPDIDLLSVIPPCEPCFDCDDLVLTSVQTSEDSCCYSIDFNNGYGPDIVKMEAEIITPDWQFNTATTNPGSGFQWYPGSVTTGSKLCVTGSSNNIPAGANPAMLDYCFSPAVASPSGPQVVVFKYYTILNDSLFELQCTDTLTTECMPMINDPCITVDEIDFECNPDNAYEYTVNLTVTNNSGFTASNVTLSGLNAGFQFAACGTSAGTNSIAIPIAGGFPDGTTQTICVKIIAPIPILNPTQACFNIGINSFTNCCHSPEEVCITLDPCCDPCEDISTTFTPITIADQDVCCYSMQIDYTCDYLFFNKIRFSSQTVGVTFGYHALGNSNFQMCGSSPTDLCVEPITGPLSKGNYANVIDICFDGINDPSQIPQIIQVDYITIAPGTNQDTVACSEELTFECDEIPNLCLEVSDQELICVPDSNKYRYTFKIKNISTLPFNATHADVFIMSPTDLAFTPSGGAFPLTPNLGPNQSQTISSCIESLTSTFPSIATDIVFGYRLRYNAGDTCCYESILDTIAIPPCDDVPTDCFSVVDIEAKKIECDINDCYENPYCQPWVIDVITNAGCFGISTASFEKAMYNGNPVFVLRQFYIDSVTETVYSCSGEILQMCNDFMGIPIPCNPFAGINLATDLTSVQLVWDCSMPLPTYNPGNCLTGPGLSQIDYCIKIMNNSPAGYTANQINLNPLLPAGITVTPTTISQTIPSGGMATINFSVRGYLLPTDVVTIEGILSGLDINEETWECTDTILLPVPECPMDECCTDEEEFLNDVAQGFQITNLGDCTYQVCANQFDTCHWFPNLGPDWGDGSFLLPAVLQSNPPNNCWTHQYTTNGVFKISLPISEGASIDESCWEGLICGEVVAECCDEDPCDDVNVTTTPISTMTDSCCTLFTIDNNYCADYFKGIRVELAAPASVSQISALNGYVVNQISPQVAEVKPLFGFIGVGVRDAFILCTTGYTTNPHQVTASWLVPGPDDTCIAECESTHEIGCDVDPPVPDKCYEFVTDSIDCERNTYCFKIKNTSTPAFDINSVHIYDLSGSLGLSPSGRITIPTLPSGMTSDWICVSYFGVNSGDNACFKISAHNTPANLPPTTCCTDTLVTCFTVPDCPQESCGVCPNGEMGGANMVINSDFGGGYTGFTSGLIQQNTGLLSANRYSIRNQTNLVNTQWNAIDHTTGTAAGNFLVIDGPSGNTAYSTTVNVVPNTTYVFCMWVDNLVASSVQSNPVIEIIIGGQVLEAGRLLPKSPDGWQLITLTYNSGTASGPITIDVKDIGGFQYNDWAIDDVSFRECGVTVDLCCDDLDSTAIFNYYNANITVVNNECEGCVTVDIDSCDVAYVDFGNGEIQLTDLVPICESYSTSGTYGFTIRIERRNAAGEICFEQVFGRSFDIECPPVDDCCDVTDTDILLYYGANIINDRDSCDICVTIPIDSCDTFEFGFDNEPFVSYSGMPTICKTYSDPGPHSYTYRITRFDMNGDTCYTGTFGTQFDLLCDPPDPDPCCDTLDEDELDTYYSSNINFDTNSCSVCVIADLDSCDVGTITFSGSSPQPLLDNTQICNQYTASGVYSYIVDIVRYNIEGDTCYHYQRQEEFDIECTNPPIPPCVEVVADSIDCETNTYCFKVRNNTLPGWTIRSLAFVNESADHTLTPDPVSIIPLSAGATSDWICVDYMALSGDTVCFNLVAHQEDLGAGDEPEFCCSNPEPVCFIVPDCDQVCCEDEDGFYDLLDIGWAVSQNGCSVTVSAPQLDSCHWLSQAEPDWGDGNVTGQVITSATGTWTHVYSGGVGTITICATIFEGDNPDDACFSGEMCTEVELIDCPEPPVPCDATGVTIFNAMTPNGDGLNDRLVVNGGSDCTKNIKIYNRWGQEIWAQLNYQNDWTGQSFSGEQLPDGTYFLVLEFPESTDDKLRMTQTYIELRN